MKARILVPLMSSFCYSYSMKYLKSALIYAVLAVTIFFVVGFFLETPCSSVVEYDIGEFDERYRIDRESFLSVVQKAEIPWEDFAERPLFVYTPGADFKINLLWSESQERVYQGDDLERGLDTKQNSIDTIQQRYDSATSAYESAKKTFEQKEDTFKAILTQWNNNPGTEQEYRDVKKKEAELEKELSILNKLGEKANELAQLSNEKIDEYNEGINEYNGLFDGREFDAGDTDGSMINVYSFDGDKELYTLLVHEFGHVLGIDHVEDPSSTMYYLLNEENEHGILTDIDKEALVVSCGL